MMPPEAAQEPYLIIPDLVVFQYIVYDLRYEGVVVRPKTCESRAKGTQ
jgi:hypothetical protein